jgi:hypothetical protein
MNKGIETLSKEGDSDVGRISTRMNMAGVKRREAQTGKKDLPWLKIRIEDPKAMAVVCLRACSPSTDIDQTNIDQLAGFARTSNVAKEGTCTFTATTMSRKMDMNMADSAKAQFSTTKQTKVILMNRFGTIYACSRESGMNSRTLTDGDVA